MTEYLPQAGNQTGLFRAMVVGVGGSDRSFTALQYGLDLAKRARSKLRAVVVEELAHHASMAMTHGEHLARLVREAERLASSIGENVAQRALKQARDAQVKLVVNRIQGDAHHALVEAGREASLLIIGRNGQRAKRGAILGSNTELIVRRTHKPILLTPDQHRPITRITLAYAGKDGGEPAARAAAAMASLLKLPLTVVTVGYNFARIRDAHDRAEALLRGRTRDVSFTSTTGDPVRVLVEHATTDALLVMGAYGHSRLYHMTLGSVTEQVIREANGPVLLAGKQISQAEHPPLVASDFTYANPVAG
jgi:nucleotide-binding universal stress UspA family protein